MCSFNIFTLAINKIPKFNLSLFYFDKIFYVSRLIFFDLWKNSTKCLLVSHTLSACYLHELWGGGGSNGLVSSHILRPHPRGGGGEGARGCLIFGHPHL